MPVRLLRGLIAGGCLILVSVGAPAGPEFNPVVRHPVSIGPEASRFVVGFRATAANQVVKTLHRARMVTVVQAQTHGADVAALAGRAHVTLARSRQLTPSMHVMYLQKTLYGADVDVALEALRADPAVKFAEVDQRRYPHTVPDDPLFQPSTDADGQWFMLTPSTATAASDAAATDAISAWSITTGSTGTVIADVDTGVLFTHPDLLRAGFGGRLLPGYDFVSGDLDPTTSAELDTYLIANDGDGWDPDPTDPGDWIDAADQGVVDVDGHNLFAAASCPIADSSWHGTRVMGLLGALTNNAVGVAGMTWNPYLLPVRALGKCGGYDSDIIAGMEWAVGMTVNGVTDNPYPADIVNLSLGGSGSCPSDYADAVSTLTGMGVLIVASAGNEGGGVDAPGNCSGVLGVAGLRNVGTKVAYSSYGAEVSVSAPAGNCVNTSGPCLRSMDTTTNSGLTVAAANAYTDEYNYNVGTSFSAPVVSGIAALMRGVNANLTPAQLIARIRSSASPFPQPPGLAVCTSSSGETECACPNNGSQCGAGMVNALAAVTSAQRPIAAVLVPITSGLGSSVTLDAGGSAASCGRTIASYAWIASGSVVVSSGMTSAKATITASGVGTVTLTVTDSAGAVDSATLTVSSNGVVTAAATTPSSAGTMACPTTLTVTPAVPTVTESFSPETVNENVTSTLTVTFANTNGFALTQSSFSATLPSNLTVPTPGTTAAAETTCTGAQISLTTTSTGVALTNAVLPANGSCALTIAVKSAQAGAYTETTAVGDLTTAPAGSNAAGASATLTVTAPPRGGGGALDWWDTLFVVGVLLAGRRHSKRGRRP